MSAYPNTLTEAIARVADRIAPLPWTDEVFGRVAYYPHQVAGQEKPAEVPMVLVGGQYVDARPNDSYKSVVFFYAPDVEKSDFDRSKHSPHHAIRAERRVSLIGWVNLDRMPNGFGSTDGYAEAIKVNLKEALKWETCVVKIGDWADGDIGKVFKPFLVSDLNRRYSLSPFACWRLELTLMCIEQ